MLVILFQPQCVNGWSISCEIALGSVSLDLTDDKLTLVNDLVPSGNNWTSHYLSQCWPISMSPYGIPRPQWVNSVSRLLQYWDIALKMIMMMLIHWGREKMADILQTAFSNAFSWMKIVAFWFKIFFSRAQYDNISSDNGLSNRQQALTIAWTSTWLSLHISDNRPWWVNSLAPGKFEWNFRYVIFKRILVIDGWGISCEIALIWMSMDFTDDQSTLVQVMAWCHQATSHYLTVTWANVDPDLCCHMAPLGHNELKSHEIFARN